MQNAGKFFTIVFGLALSAAPVSSQASEDPQMPSSQRAREAMCSVEEHKPGWCSEIGLGGPPSWTDGDWTVIKYSDEMDVDKRASVRTDLYTANGVVVGWLRIDVWNSGSLIVHSANTGSPDSVFYSLGRRREGWPQCVGDLDRIAVDETPVQYLATIERGGRCNRVHRSGSAITAMKRGTTAKIRLGGDSQIYHLSLKGFTAAINRATGLTQR